MSDASTTAPSNGKAAFGLGSSATSHAKGKPNERVIQLVFAALILLVLIVAFIALRPAGPNPTPTPTTGAKATLNAILLQAPSCADCVDAQAAVQSLQASGATVNVQRVDASSPEGQSLLVRYGVTRVPTVVVLNASDVSGAANADVRVALDDSFDAARADGSRVWRVNTPTYIAVNSLGVLGGVVGRVTLTFVNDSTCRECFQVLGLMGSQLAQAGVNVQPPRLIELNSTEGRDLVRAYNVTRAPALFLSKDFNAYPGLVARFLGNATNADGSRVAGIGVQAPDGTFVMTQTLPPYVATDTGAVLGLTDITYVTFNESCDFVCYDAHVHKDLLYRTFGVVFRNEFTYAFNSTEGAHLVQQYNITKVPTVILSRDALLYTGLGKAWLQIPLGTIETGGTLVFRNLDAIGNVTYYDLSKNAFVNLNTTNVTTSGGVRTNQTNAVTSNGAA